MTAIAVLATLRHRQVVFYVDGDRLIYKAPAGALTNDLGASIREHKAALMRLLTTEAEASSQYRYGNPCNWPNCYSPIRLTIDTGNLTEWRCGYGHPQDWEPIVADGV